MIKQQVHIKVKIAIYTTRYVINVRGKAGELPASSTTRNEKAEKKQKKIKEQTHQRVA